MMSNKGVVAVFCVVFLGLFASFVSADFEASAEGVSNSIRPDEQAVFTLTIKNNGDTADTFRLSMENVEWNVLSRPLYDYFGGLDIAPGASKSTTLFISPAEPLALGTHRVILRIESANTGIARRVEMPVHLKSPIPSIRDYLATVGRIVQISPQVDPRNPAVVIINLQNRNIKNITKLDIKLASNLINQETSVALGPLEKKIVKLTAELDPKTPPQIDILTVTFTVDGQELSPAIKEGFEIVSYSDVQQTTGGVKKGFLSTTEEITFLNKGNVMAQQSYEKQTNFLRKIFTRSDPRAFQASREEGSFLTWSFALQPGESKTIKVTESYLPLFVIIALLGVVALGWYVTRSPVVIRKEATIVGLSEGGISDVKVVLHVKNRTSKTFKDVKITDKIPHIARVGKDFQVGTLKPKKIFTSPKHGTVLRWEIDRMEKFEERIISYTLRSKLSILGGFRLPQAVMKFKDSKGKEKTTRSNIERIVHKI